ncbi:MAG: nicotinamide mononucleotide transporter [Gammaproteobacteria bacterium]|nr:nicotinamide mononucleotide transporter [Gammaproteobacteria bacterium]
MADSPSLFAQLASSVAATSPVEGAAVVLAVAYLLLAMRQDRRCWIAGGVSAVMFLWVFAGSHVYLQAALQAVYIGLAFYGWQQWKHGAAGAAMPVSVGSLRGNLWAMLAIAAATVVVALALSAWTDSPSPWLDTGTTLASLFATSLTARKRLESWLWWIAINVVTAVLFWQQQLLLTATLYCSYSVMAVGGFRSWRRSMGSRP